MPQTIRRAIGSRFKEARLKAGLTQDQVASYMQCSRQAVSSWERGATMPNVLEVRELALLYVESTDQLLIGLENWKAARTEILDEMRREQQSPPEFADT